MRTHRITWSLVTAIVLATAACSDSGTVLGPDNQLEVTNAADNFQLQATALDNVSQTLSYVWQMSGDMGNVNQSGTLTGGSATLTILDDAGAQVYTRSLGQTGTFQTSKGVAGSWTIRVDLNGASGNLNFRVQKP